MLLFVYLILFLALSAALTWWRVTSYQRRFELAPRSLSRESGGDTYLAPGSVSLANDT